MSGLILKLAPKERILINGAVLENGEKRTKISIKTPNANILRLRDAIHPNDADTPVSRLCYICQLILTGDTKEDAIKEQILLALSELSKVFSDPDSTRLLKAAAESIAESNYYATLRHLKSLLPREERLLSMRSA
ncbi:MAG: flagellar biosynthesis repressor FlbT [Paracoccus sp. (in: a-proteobacteria)]|uniref:flagellar biosynthesis repressor FlbT n=1 Tax=Paracoccus sp. TaxID=267 RepID=UPI0039E3D6D3